MFFHVFFLLTVRRFTTCDRSLLRRRANGRNGGHDEWLQWLWMGIKPVLKYESCMNNEGKELKNPEGILVQDICVWIYIYMAGLHSVIRDCLFSLMAMAFRPEPENEQGEAQTDPVDPWDEEQGDSVSSCRFWTVNPILCFRRIDIYII